MFGERFEASDVVPLHVLKGLVLVECFARRRSSKVDAQHSLSVM